LVGAGIKVSRDALGMTTFNWRDTSKTAIAVGSVTGYVGNKDGGSGNTGGAAPTGTYGFTVNGSTCTGTDTQQHQNTLSVTYMWQSGDATSWTINANVGVYQKKAQQNTQDGNCAEGPPTWTATGTVTAEKPHLQGQAAGGQAGSAAQAYAHTGNPTSWYLGYDQSPVPPGYSNESQSMAATAWNVDPADPATQTRTVESKVDQTFTGTGVEIVVITCFLSVKVTLSASCT
jgi:hypothetical protein